MNEPTHLDLFSGIGGFALAARQADFRTVAFVEIDKYCQRVLAKNFLGYPTECKDWRLQQSQFPSNIRAGSPIFADIFTLDGTQFRGVDLITGGFPCQPFSIAGKRRGKEDDRAIWPEMLRVITQARPAWVLGENVPGIITMELDNVLSDLEAIGYATRAFTIPACAVDARHRRDRVWIVAHAIDSGNRGRGRSDREEDEIPGVNRQALRGGLSCGTSQELADSQEQRDCGISDNADSSEYCESQREFGGSSLGTQRQACHWLPKPDVGRVVDELPSWLDGPCIFEPEPSIPRVAIGVENLVDRLKGLGNAIVPNVAFELLREIRHLI